MKGFLFFILNSAFTPRSSWLPIIWLIVPLSVSPSPSVLFFILETAGRYGEPDSPRILNVLFPPFLPEASMSHESRELVNRTDDWGYCCSLFDFSPARSDPPAMVPGTLNSYWLPLKFNFSYSSEPTALNSFFLLLSSLLLWSNSNIPELAPFCPLTLFSVTLFFENGFANFDRFYFARICFEEALGDYYRSPDFYASGLRR